MSPEALDVMTFMLRDLTGMKYFFDETVSGCYDAAVGNYGYPVPPEGKEAVLAAVKVKLHEIGY